MLLLSTLLLLLLCCCSVLLLLVFYVCFIMRKKKNAQILFTQKQQREMLKVHRMWEILQTSLHSRLISSRHQEGNRSNSADTAKSKWLSDREQANFDMVAKVQMYC